MIWLILVGIIVCLIPLCFVEKESVKMTKEKSDAVVTITPGPTPFIDPTTDDYITRIRVRCENGSRWRRITYHPEYRKWFVWYSIKEKIGLEWQTAWYCDVKYAQRCIDDFLKGRERPTIITTYIDYP